MATHTEKLAFSERLQQALNTAGVAASSPTAVARKFNLLYRGEPVSVQAVRRWLEGTAIPAQDKLVILANWLKVSPEWLRFGEQAKPSRAASRAVSEQPVVYDAQALASLIELLCDEHRQVVSRIVTALLESEGKAVKPPGR
jgi:transcriptional regulator with XRE-family HTH domain